MWALTKIKYSRQLIIWPLLSAALIIGGIFYWQHALYYPSTDDAYVQANTVNIAAQISGPVQAVYVQDHQTVNRGAVLFTIDPAPFQLAVQTAQAQLTQRQAELNNIKLSTTRTLALAAKNLASKAEADAATMQLKVAQAAMAAAQQNLAQAQLDLQHTRVVAPENGTVTNFNLRAGTMVNAGVILFAFIERAHWWIDANFKETELGRIKVGQAAQVSVDLYPDHTYHGKVQGISLGSGAAFSLLPPENATGNWVKVTQRFTVRVDITDPDPAFPLRVGASSTVTIDTQ